MDSLFDLLNRHPQVFFHMVCAMGALAVGGVVLSRRKGTADHKALGWAWVALMGSAAVTSAFIREYRLPNLWGFTPIHLFTLTVAVTLPRAILAIRQGNVASHRRMMRSLYIGGCIVAGLLTLLPGRFLGHLLWKQTLGLLA